MLTEAEARELWGLFGSTPLFARWPEAQAQIATMIDRVQLATDRVLFRPGDAPVSLFLVGQGKVEATFRRDGRIWLQRRYEPGQHFGQEALFANEYRAMVIASADAILYRMSASDLRVAMERNPDLHENLLREGRAGHLRRIPLFSALENWQVLKLAQVVEERELEAGTELNLAEAPGIWIVDWGQVEIAGPVNPLPAEWPRWSLTAGNFFVAPGPGLRFGAGCNADRARTRVKTHFFYLAAEHADRLIAAFPEIGAVIQRPFDITNFLQKVQTLQGLSNQQHQHLAQYCGWEFVPRNLNITNQGAIGHTLVILVNGAALVTAIDDRGRPRPRNFLGREDWYGSTSLLEGGRRDATVRAVKAQDQVGRAGLDGVEVITLDRRDLQDAFAERPDLWHTNVPLFDQVITVKKAKQPYDWMEDGEALRWRSRPHILWLLLPELAIALSTLLVILLVSITSAGWRSTLGVASLIGGAPLVLLLVTWVVINYRDDYYAVTNLRVTRRDRQLLMYETRVEAPLEMVQNVTVNVDFWGNVFRYGDVSISTAAKARAFVFQHVPNPWKVQALILTGRVEAMVAGSGQRKELLRRELISGLKLVLPVPDRVRALGEAAQTEADQSRAGIVIPWLSGLSRRLQATRIGLFAHPGPQSPGEILWRKHWINLLWRTSRQILLLVVLSASAGLNLRFGITEMFGIESTGWVLPWLFLLFVGVLWLAYEYADWYNDVYIVTNTQLIDIEKTPLGLSEKRRQANLDRIQTVDAKQESFWRVVLGYGDVIIRTAAADEGLDFLSVPNPKAVQSVIFQRVEAARRRQEQQRASERQQDVIEALELYHQVQQER